MRFLLTTVVMIGLPFAGFGQLCGHSYESRVVEIHTQASLLPGLKERLVMVGSSTIRKWPAVDSVFSEYEVVNAGFGGSCFEDLWVLRESLIYRLQPDVLLIYEGDNDLHDRVPESRILATAEALLVDLASRLPRCRVVLVAAKPSPARYHLQHEYLSLNNKLRSTALANGAFWVDFWTAQHDQAGRLRLDLFDRDQLHLNALGYQVWAQELSRQQPWIRPAEF